MLPTYNSPQVGVCGCCVHSCKHCSWKLCTVVLYNGYAHTQSHAPTIIIAGNFKTQAASNIISSICAIVMIFSTWQYTLNPPSCCPSESENVTLNADQAEGCKELQRDILLSSLNLHIPPSINIATSIIAVVVCALKQCSIRYACDC